MNFYAFLFTASFLVVAKNAACQHVINYEIESKGLIELSEEVSIPKINAGYTLWVPEDKKANGLITFFHARRDTIEADFIVEYAMERGLAVAFITTDNRVEFLFDSSKTQALENYIYNIISTYNIPKHNLLYCGMSLAGTRALKVTLFADHSKYKIKPRALAICDAPLDMVRFHKEAIKAKELNFNPLAANEGKWVSEYLERNLRGAPTARFEAYLEYSPYSYHHDAGQHAAAYHGIAVRCYTEPDIKWWMETRRKDYYGMNAVDLAAFINDLHIHDHTEAELIITADKGRRPDGSRHPHSWSIVDEKEMVDWFLGLIAE